MKRKIAIGIAGVLFCLAIPATSFAMGLTNAQASAIVGLLQAFNVDAVTLANVEQALGLRTVAIPIPPSGTILPTPTQPETQNPHVPVIGSIYNTSGMGYDLSYATINYPTIPFGFAVVGVTGGKAFVHNPRIDSEFSWARFGSTARPTLYVNLNAAYGSTASAENTSGPKNCSGDPPPVVKTTASAGGTFPEPSLCKSYNYGYRIAQDALAYATAHTVSAPFWWLDVEEANSWSEDTAVNDATIQGAIDYLNSQDIRAGIYSMPSMWNAIAGASFVPTQKINGESVSTPTWLPVGLMNQLTAINTCITTGSFIPGSPVWIVQYEDSATAIDRNIAC